MTTMCDYCGGTGEIETDNNGPIVPCPVCKPLGRDDRIGLADRRAKQRQPAHVGPDRRKPISNQLTEA